MQSYMIEMSQNKSIEETEKVPDRAVVDFRKAVKEKREETENPVSSLFKLFGDFIKGGFAAGKGAAGKGIRFSFHIDGVFRQGEGAFCLGMQHGDAPSGGIPAVLV